jgi:hypothetical protein
MEPILDNLRAASDIYNGFDFGTFNLPTAGTYSLTFTITGKDASSSSDMSNK